MTILLHCHHSINWLAFTAAVLSICTNLQLSYADSNQGFNAGRPIPSMNEKEDHQRTAVVIGASLAGMSAALGLAKVGMKVELLDKKQDRSRQGAVLGLAPNGLKALEELLVGSNDNEQSDMLRKLRESGIPMPKGGVMLPWAVLRDFLFDLVGRNDNISYRPGLVMLDIDDDPSSPSAKVTFSNNDLVLEGDIIVGADGVNSRVRQVLGLPAALQTGTTCWRGVLDASKSGSEFLYLLDRGIAPLVVKEDGLFFLSFNFHDKIPGKIAWALSSTDPQAKDCEHPLDLPIFKDGSSSNKDAIKQLRAIIDESSSSQGGAINRFNQQ